MDLSMFLYLSLPISKIKELGQLCAWWDGDSASLVNAVFHFPPQLSPGMELALRAKQSAPAYYEPYNP